MNLVNPFVWIFIIPRDSIFMGKAVVLMQEVTPHKTTAVRPLTSYLKKQPSKTNNTYGTLLEKQGQIHK